MRTGPGRDPLGVPSRASRLHGRRLGPAVALPEFHGGGRPIPESVARRTLLQAVAVTSIAFTAVYLAWRLAAGTVDLDVWWVSVPLFVAELHNGVGLLLFTIALWDVDAGSAARRVLRTQHKLAVLIPTYNEPESVLLPTVAAAVALQPAHETWVLDDGRRPQIERMAAALGASYLTRPSNEHFKAGNLNHALARIEADFVAVLDADHVPLPGLLRNTLGYFDDPRIAVVQTPQDFYNTGSFEHVEQDNGSRFMEEAIFYRVIAPAKNRWGGAFWCGTSAVLRTAALAEVGGVSVDSVTEDIQTTIRLNRRGWKAVFHNEVLARGLAPSDAVQYWTQRNRWALGAMQVLRRDNPLFAPGLSFGQRLSFATTLAGWFDSWRTLVYMVVPPLVILTGASPIRAAGSVYGPLFMMAFLSQFAALRLLARGRYPPLLSLLFEVLRLPAVLPATLAILTGGSTVFKVTPKAPDVHGDRRVPVPPLLIALLIVTTSTSGWFIATLLGWTPTAYAELPSAIGAAVFNGVNIALLLWAVHRIRLARFAGERRWAIRLPVHIPARLDGRPCAVVDLSVTGAQVRIGSFAVVASQDCELEIDLPGHSIQLKCRVKNRARGDGSALVGLEFDGDQQREIASVALSLMWGVGYGNELRSFEAA